MNVKHLSCSQPQTHLSNIFWLWLHPFPNCRRFFKWRETDNQLDAASVTIIEIEWNRWYLQTFKVEEKVIALHPWQSNEGGCQTFPMASYRERWYEAPQWGPNTQRKAQSLGIFTGHQGCSFQEPRKCLHCRTRLWKMPCVSQEHLDRYTCSL